MRAGLTDAGHDAADHEREHDEGEEAQEDLSREVQVHHLARVQLGLGVRLGRQAQVRSQHRAARHTHQQQRDLHRVATAASTTTAA